MKQMTFRSNTVQGDGDTFSVKVAVIAVRDDGKWYPEASVVTLTLHDGHYSYQRRGHNLLLRDTGEYVERHIAIEDTVASCARAAVRDALDCFDLLDGYKVGARFAKHNIMLTLTPKDN